MPELPYLVEEWFNEISLGFLALMAVLVLLEKKLRWMKWPLRLAWIAGFMAMLILPAGSFEKKLILLVLIIVPFRKHWITPMTTGKYERRRDWWTVFRF